MIAEYKLYHGAVLAELVDRRVGPVSVDELSEEGRLSCYILDGKVGMMVKHSAQRLYPWTFTFTTQNLLELDDLRRRTRASFVVLVCSTDGMVCLTVAELGGLMALTGQDQAGVRVERRRRRMYGVSGGGEKLGHKKPSGLDAILEALSSEG